MKNQIAIERFNNTVTEIDIIKDISAALNWIKEKYPKKKISIVGFCFGGHAAVIASSLKGIDSTFCLANFSEKLLIQRFIPNTSGKTIDIYSHSRPESTHQDLRGKSPL